MTIPIGNQLCTSVGTKEMGKIIGTKTPQQALDSLVNMTGDLRPIELSEYKARIAKA